MPAKLRQYLNRSILVSIPVLFGDSKCQPYRLVSIENDGLWLSSEALSARVLAEAEGAKGTPQAIFIPAAQIAAIALPPPVRPEPGVPPPQIAAPEAAKPAPSRRGKSAAE